MADVAERYGFTIGWLSRWLARFEDLGDEPLEEVVSDKPRDGRPAELPDEAFDKFVEVLQQPPEKVKSNAAAWSVPLDQHYLTTSLVSRTVSVTSVDYCERPDCLGRPPGRSSTSPKTEARRRGKTASKKCDDLDDGYTILTIDRTRQCLSSFINAWFPVNGRHTVPVTGKRGNIKLLGAVSDSDEMFFLACAENFTSDTTVRLLDALQTKFGEKICVILNNALYFTGNSEEKSVEDTPIKLCYLLRGTPDLNPTEECRK